MCPGKRSFGKSCWILKIGFEKWFLENGSKSKIQKLFKKLEVQFLDSTIQHDLNSVYKITQRVFIYLVFRNSLA